MSAERIQNVGLIFCGGLVVAAAGVGIICSGSANNRLDVAIVGIAVATLGLAMLEHSARKLYRITAIPPFPSQNEVQRVVDNLLDPTTTPQ